MEEAENISQDLKTALHRRYREVLEVIAEKDGELKDYTYLAILVTETGKWFKTRADYEESGILDYAETSLAAADRILDYAETNLAAADRTSPRLVTLSLNLAEVMLTVPELRVRILEAVDRNLAASIIPGAGSGSEANDSVLTALLKLYHTYLSTEPEGSNEITSKLVTRREFLDLVLACLIRAKSYYTQDAAKKCFLELLHYLSNNKNTKGEKEVNLMKIRQNLLLDFFDKVVDPNNRRIYLTHFLKNCRNQNLEQELIEFMQAKISCEEKKLNRSNVYLLLKILAKDEDSKVYLQDPNPKLQMLVVYEMIKMIDSRPGFLNILIDYFENLEDDENFLYFLNTPRHKWEKPYMIHGDDICVQLANHPALYTHIQDKCLSLWRLYLQHPDSTSPLYGRINWFLGKSMRNGNKIDRISEFTKIALDLLSKFIGVSDEVKSQMCGLFIHIFRSAHPTNYTSDLDLDQLMETLLYLAVNSASTWELKDSALEVVALLLPHHPPNQEQTDKLMNVVESCRRDQEMYIRSSIFPLMTGLVNSWHGAANPLREEEKLLMILQETMLNDKEAVVRRSAVDFLSHFVLKISDSKVKSLVKIGLHAVSKDLDWEVKRKSVKFWSNHVDRLKSRDLDQPIESMHSTRDLNQPIGSTHSTTRDQDQPISGAEADEQLIKQLEESGVLSALVYGCTDYESSVRKEYRNLTERVMSEFDLEAHSLNKLRKLDLGDMNGGGRENGDGDLNNKVDVDLDEEDIDEMIETVVVAEDADLVQDLAVAVGNEVAGDKDIQPAELQAFPKVESMSVNTFLERINSLENEEQRPNVTSDLTSVLEDILQSVSGEGMVEVIDCY